MTPPAQALAEAMKCAEGQCGHPEDAYCAHAASPVIAAQVRRLQADVEAFKVQSNFSQRMAGMTVHEWFDWTKKMEAEKDAALLALADRSAFFDEIKKERDAALARAKEAERDCRKMFSVIKDVQNIVRSADRHIGIEQLIAIFAPLREDPKANDPLKAAEAKVERLREALLSECLCACRPHALGKDMSLECLRCKALSATEAKP